MSFENIDTSDELIAIMDERLADRYPELLADVETARANRDEMRASLSDTERFLSDHNDKSPKTKTEVTRWAGRKREIEDALTKFEEMHNEAQTVLDGYSQQLANAKRVIYSELEVEVFTYSSNLRSAHHDAEQKLKQELRQLKQNQPNHGMFLGQQLRMAAGTYL